jgi:hypothetical protein
MGAYLIWWSSIVLEMALLLRAARTGLFRKYPFFYVYIFCVFLKEVVRLLSYWFAPNFYVQSYWLSELATIGASYGVIIEIYRGMLESSAGVAHGGRRLLLFVFVLGVSAAAADLSSRRGVSFVRVVAELARDFRYIEGALLLVILWLLGRYRIVMEHNLFGLITGFSLWVGINIINLALLFLPGNGYSVGLRQILPITYVITLVIWCVSLWSLPQEPVPPLARFRLTSGTSTF